MGHLSSIHPQNLPSVPFPLPDAPHPQPSLPNVPFSLPDAPHPSPVSLKLGHLSSIHPPNLPDVPQNGTPVKHPAPKPPRCPLNWDTSQTFSPQTCPVSPKLGHLSRIHPPNLPDVPKTGTPVNHPSPKPARCPLNWDTGQIFSPQTCPMSQLWHRRHHRREGTAAEQAPPPE